MEPACLLSGTSVGPLSLAPSEPPTQSLTPSSVALLFAFGVGGAVLVYEIQVF